MGLAVLPARLKDELDGVARALVRGDDLRADETLAKHADWAEELKTRYTFTAENAGELLGRRWARCSPRFWSTPAFSSVPRRAGRPFEIYT